MAPPVLLLALAGVVSSLLLLLLLLLSVLWTETLEVSVSALVVCAGL